MIKEVKATIPELAQDKIKKYIKQGISLTDAQVIAQERLLAELFEKVAEQINPVLAAKWLRRELVRVMHYTKKELHQLEIDEKHLIALLRLVESKQITDKTAQKLMEKLIATPFDVDAYVEEEGLIAITGKEEIEQFCRQAIEENPKAVEDYKAGNQKALQFIVGQVMRLSKGKASPKEVNQIVKKLLKS